MGDDVLDALEAARRAEETVVMGTTVRTEGNPPSAPGNRALFALDGRLLAGTIGCNGLDRRAGADAAELVTAGERTGLRTYTSFEGEPGEGAVEVFLETFGGRPRLLVGSPGPVADMLATLGTHLGLAVKAEPDIDTPAFAERAAALGPRDAVVFVDHDAPGLVGAVGAALAGKAGYVGVMGSRRHTPGFVADLRAAGADLSRLHSPTGLDIGARVPAEIALSILAEVLAATRGRPGGSLDVVNAAASDPARSAQPTA